MTVLCIFLLYLPFFVEAFVQDLDAILVIFLFLTFLGGGGYILFYKMFESASLFSHCSYRILAYSRECPERPKYFRTFLMDRP